MEPVGHEAEAAKQEGNDSFRQKQYTKAGLPSESLQHKPIDPSYRQPPRRCRARAGGGRARRREGGDPPRPELRQGLLPLHERAAFAARNSSAGRAAPTCSLQPTNAQPQALLEQANEAKRREEPMYGDGDDDDDDEGEYDDTDGEGEEETDEDMDDDDDDDDEAWASLKNPADMEVEGGGGRLWLPASRVSVIDALDPTAPPTRRRRR